MIQYYIEMKPIRNSLQLYDKIKFHDSNLIVFQDKTWCYGKVRLFRELSYILFWCMQFADDKIELTTYSLEGDEKCGKEKGS